MKGKKEGQTQLWNKKKTRPEAHQMGADFVHRSMTFLKRHSDVTIQFRAGWDKASDLNPHIPNNLADRSAGRDKPTAIGQDVYLKLGGKVVWASLLSNYRSYQRMWPHNNVWRTTAPEKGLPDDKIVRVYFGPQWGIWCKYKEYDDPNPCKIYALPFQVFLDLPFKIGYRFPGHKGRESTVEFLLNDDRVTRHLRRAKFPQVDPEVLIKSGKVLTEYRHLSIRGLIENIFEKSA